MPADSDLLFALLALQMNLLSREKLLEAAAVWMGAPGESFARLLEARGFLTAEKAAAVRAIVEARMRSSAAPPSPTATPSSLPDAAPGRYTLLGELGRGGLGRVVEAWDAALRRGVAVKLLHEEQAGDAPDRFGREARLAARLEHPAIIPVYDYGRLASADGHSQVYMAMKRVRGRDLDQVLQALMEGQADARRNWTRARLLRVFQDVCLGMAFAHDRGVIHRDLKPSNIMIGDYGETLIVDWGLAKELRSQIEGEAVEGASSAQKDASKVTLAMKDPKSTVLLAASPRKDKDDPEAIELSRVPDLTFAGDIIGTPAYMSPEQAEGRVGDIDARSDIFSLGAILYEILALKPPFEGRSVEEVMTRVRDGNVTPPSLARRERPAFANPPSSTTLVGDAVPPELDAICLRALARRPADRYQTARELHDELQLFLEGVKHRERQRAAADLAVQEVRAALRRREALDSEAAEARKEALRLDAATPPRTDKSLLWAAEDRARALARAAATAHADAVAALARALEHDKEHPAARSLMADLAWASFLEAEAAGDEAAALIHRRVAEEYHDGRLEAQLRGEGTLTVRARAFPCDCLSRGRTVFSEELRAGEHHLFSGRSFAGTPGAEGVPGLEPKTSLVLRVHGSSCEPEPLAGAEAWLYRFEDIGRRLIPVTPGGLSGSPPPAVEALFEADSAFKPRGPGLHLGRLPVEKKALPTGSYLLVVSREGRVPARVPVFISRGAHAEQQVTLFRPGELPAAFAPVAAGTFEFQGDRENPYSGPAQTPHVPDFLLARRPVTCREYAAFLNELPDKEALRRAPRETPDGPPYWPAGPWRPAGRRLLNTSVDWDENWPVTGISWDDALAFMAWKRSREPWLFTLPSSVQWEKSARGPDRRFYPWGRHLDERWCNGERSHEGGPRPVAVTAFPDDESPYGVRGLGGNTRDACLDDGGAEFPGRRQFRGGTWARPGIESRASDRTAFMEKGVSFDFGFRCAAVVKLGTRTAQ